MTKYRYDNGELVQLPTIEEPQAIDFIGDSDGWVSANFNYAAHLMSLRHIEASGEWPESLKGIDLEEGKHFRLQHQFLSSPPLQGPQIWEDCGEEDYHLTNVNYRRVIAIPILPPAETEKKSNDMKKYNGWNDNKSTASGVGGQPAPEPQLEWDTDLQNVGLPSNMYFGKGAEFGEITYRLKVSNNKRYCVFKVDGTYYVIKQFKYGVGWNEEWTKQMNSSLDEAKKYAENDFKPEQKEEKVYTLTLQQMIEIYYAGLSDDVSFSSARYPLAKKYFKEKFNIDLP